MMSLLCLANPIYRSVIRPFTTAPVTESHSLPMRDNSCVLPAPATEHVPRKTPSVPLMPLSVSVPTSALGYASDCVI